MTLSRTTTTPLTILPREISSRNASTSPETTPAAGDSVQSQGEPTPPARDTFDAHTIPADDDGPGAGGGYAPVQDPAESDGPGAGGGYDSDEIPSDDDGPGAGGGYDYIEQDPAESDGPGAGGGYATVSGHWSQPLAVFSVNLAPPHDIDLKSQYNPHWVQALPLETFNWMSQSLLVNQGSAQPESTENKGEQK